MTNPKYYPPNTTEEERARMQPRETARLPLQEDEAYYYSPPARKKIAEVPLVGTGDPDLDKAIANSLANLQSEPNDTEADVLRRIIGRLQRQNENHIKIRNLQMAELNRWRDGTSQMEVPKLEKQVESLLRRIDSMARDREILQAMNAAGIIEITELKRAMGEKGTARGVQPITGKRLLDMEDVDDD